VPGDRVDATEAVGTPTRHLGRLNLFNHDRNVVDGNKSTGGRG